MQEGGSALREASVLAPCSIALRARLSMDSSLRLVVPRMMIRI